MNNSETHNSLNKVNDDSMNELGFKEKVSKEVEQTSEYFAQKEANALGSYDSSWSIAGELVKKIMPVPRLFWVIIHSVYGASGEVKDADPMTFTLIENLLIKALSDPDLVANETPLGRPTLTKTVKALGPDVCASLCFLYCVSRRVSVNLNERVLRAIMDDALLRSRIGVVLGREAPHLGIGRCLLTGFAGRAGLAVQLASGNDDEAREALGGLAKGKDISKVCYEVYGCDSLQVAALSLVAGGFNKDIALGFSSYSMPNDETVAGSEQYRWLCLFTILEHLRLSTLSAVPQEYWDYLGIDEKLQETIGEEVKKVFRKGHGFTWMMNSLNSLLTKK